MRYYNLKHDQIKNPKLLSLIEAAADQARLARPNACKSGYTVKAGVSQLINNKIYSAGSGNSENGAARHAEILASDFLRQEIPPNAEVSIDVLAFIGQGIPRICGLCRDALEDKVNGISIMARNAVVVGIGDEEVTVVPWKNYLLQRWSGIKFRPNVNLLKTELTKSIPIYTERQSVVALVHDDVYYTGYSGEYSRPDREGGPVIVATQKLNDRGLTDPSCFIMAENELPKVPYTYLQMLADRLPRLGVKRPDDFRIIRIGLVDGKVEDGTLSGLLPYAFKSTKS
jgi:hypothetical protein